MKRLTAIAMGIMLALPSLAQERVEVIVLNYRTAEQVIPLVQPLVGPAGAVTGMQNRLIVRTTPERLAQIREVLAGIDTAPQRLTITVRRDAEAEAAQAGAAASARIGPGGGVSARVWSSRTEAGQADEQRIQVLEGHRAFIRTGTAVPYRSQTITRDPWGRVVVQESTTFHDVDTGFEVVPRLAGERVWLTIHPRRGQINPDHSVQVESASTTVSGRLGEWIELGGIDSAASDQGRGIAYGSRGTQAAGTRLWVRVERLP